MHNLYEREGPRLTEEDVKRVAQSKIAGLDDVERQIIALVALGLNDRQIAGNLISSEMKIREHLKTIFEKLDVSDRFELVLYAYYHSLARLPH